MPTTHLNGRLLDVRPDRVDFRDYPYRPPLISLPEQWPPQKWIDNYLPEYCGSGLALDQLKEGSCTGFGLAAVINYLKWERWKAASLRGEVVTPPVKVSERMLYQNARLYDEWKGEDYEGSSCRGAMKGFHKHGVCSGTDWPYIDGKNPGTPRDGWQTSATQTVLGAYYRIETTSVVAMQAAVREVHALYVSASVHDGWKLKKAGSLDKAIIAPPSASSERGGHAFAVVGYLSDGFIVQNSWGPNWGYQGFGVLPYEDWLQNGFDAWVLAMGAPLRTATRAIADTRIALQARAGGAPAQSAGANNGKRPKWKENQVARHVVVMGAGGRPVRHLVEALDEVDGVRKVVVDGVTEAARRNLAHIAIYAHGGLNDRQAGLDRAACMGPWLEANGIYPIFVIWQTGFFETAQYLLEAAARRLVGREDLPSRGPLLELLRDRLDYSFEVFARECGLKAIWDDMKARAELANRDRGVMSIMAAALAQPRPLKLHLIGHSAGAILLGHFLAALQKKEIPVESCHLWAPACTVEFASRTFGQAFKKILPARHTFIEQLSDSNERVDAAVPPVYSKSLLYLISRGLEPEHKTPILGLELSQPARRGDQARRDVFARDALTSLKRWEEAGSEVVYDPVIAQNDVPIRVLNGTRATIEANHGSFDNNIEVVVRAVRRIIGNDPPVAISDLTGF